MKKHRLISFILLPCTLFLVCGESMGSDRQDFSASKTYLLSKIIPLAELITSDNPSLQETIRLVGGKIEEQKKDKYVYVKNSGYSANIIIAEKNNLVSDIEIYTDLDMGIEFHRDVVPLLGKQWIEIAKKSKYPAARFIYSNRQTRKRAMVYTRLYFPPQSKIAPVQGIVIRLEPPSKTDTSP